RGAYGAGGRARDRKGCPGREAACRRALRTGVAREAHGLTAYVPFGIPVTLSAGGSQHPPLEAPGALSWLAGGGGQLFAREDVLPVALQARQIVVPVQDPKLPDRLLRQAEVAVEVLLVGETGYAFTDVDVRLAENPLPRGGHDKVAVVH